MAEKGSHPFLIGTDGAALLFMKKDIRIDAEFMYTAQDPTIERSGRLSAPWSPCMIRKIWMKSI